MVVIQKKLIALFLLGFTWIWYKVGVFGLSLNWVEFDEKIWVIFLMTWQLYYLLISKLWLATKDTTLKIIARGAHLSLAHLQPINGAHVHMNDRWLVRNEPGVNTFPLITMRYCLYHVKGLRDIWFQHFSLKRALNRFI